MTGLEQDDLTARGTVYPEDCDHMGHMNVAAYTRKFDEATWSYWLTVGMSHRSMSQAGTGIAALESNLTYRKELFPGDSYIIRTRFLSLKTRTASFHHRLYILGDDGAVEPTETLAATCTYTVACLDRAAHKACPFPESVAGRIRSKLKPFSEETAK